MPLHPDWPRRAAYAAFHPEFASPSVYSRSNHSRRRRRSFSAGRSVVISPFSVNLVSFAPSESNFIAACELELALLFGRITTVERELRVLRERFPTKFLGFERFAAVELLVILAMQGSLQSDLQALGDILSARMKIL